MQYYNVTIPALYLIPHSCACPAHSNVLGSGKLYVITCTSYLLFAIGRRGWRTAHNLDSHDYAFEMACSNIRYGPGVTQEVGMVNHERLYHVKDPLLKRIWKIWALKKLPFSLTIM